MSASHSVEGPPSVCATDQVWRDAGLARCYLEGVRGGIPLAGEQICILLRILRAARPEAATFLDLGCGDGVLGHAVLDAFPGCHGVLLDFSDTMLAACRARLSDYAARVRWVQQDYGLPGWQSSLGSAAPFDAIVSGFSIHHQPNERKQSLYREIHDLLKPGGVFLNLEHVASASIWGERLFDDHFVDALFAHHQRTRGSHTREAIADRYYRREDKVANILERVDVQCQWLRDIGFERVDCYFKVFELALFGGVKSTTTS